MSNKAKPELPQAVQQFIEDLDGALGDSWWESFSLDRSQGAQERQTATLIWL